MTEHSTGDLARPLEEAIREITGVAAARVVGDRGGRISEVHVVAAAEKSAKQVVRDIQTLAQARFGLAIDYRIVSVVRMDGPRASGVARPPDAPAAPLVLESVTWRTASGTATCRVEVRRGQDGAHGEAAGAATSAARSRLAAQAVLHAAAAIGEGRELVLDDIQIVNLGGHRVALAACSEASDSTIRPPGMFVGSSPVLRDDDVEAAARAALDAINRVET